MRKRELKLLIGIWCALLAASSVFASSTKLTARVRAVLPDGTLRCKVIKFLQIDPYELKDARRANKLPSRVDVSFNEISLPDAAPYRAEAVRRLRRHYVGRKVMVSLGLPNWPKGKVIGDAEVIGAAVPSLQFALVKAGLATYRPPGGPTDDVMYDAEQSARSRRVGMWAKPGH